MKALFRTLLICLTLLTGSACTDSQGLAERYQQAFESLRAEDRAQVLKAVAMEAEMAASAEKMGFPRDRIGWGVISRLEVVQEHAGQETVRSRLDEQNTPESTFCLASLHRDGSLELGFGAPLYAPPAIHLYVENGKAGKAVLTEWQKNNHVFRLSGGEPATDYLEIPMQVTRLQLDRNEIEPAQTLFGEVALESDWYFEEGKRQKLTVTYLFKTIVNPPSHQGQ